MEKISKDIFVGEHCTKLRSFEGRKLVLWNKEGNCVRHFKWNHLNITNV